MEKEDYEYLQPNNITYLHPDKAQNF